MPDLLCPHCQTLVSDHGRLRPIGLCNLSEAQALRAAQRRAAAEHLIMMRAIRLYSASRVDAEFKKTALEVKQAMIKQVILGYRAVGILGRK